MLREKGEDIARVTIRATRSDAEIFQRDTLGIEHPQDVVIGLNEQRGRVGKRRVRRKPSRIAMPVRRDDGQVRDGLVKCCGAARKGQHWASVCVGVEIIPVRRDQIGERIENAAQVHLGSFGGGLDVATEYGLQDRPMLGMQAAHMVTLLERQNPQACEHCAFFVQDRAHSGQPRRFDQLRVETVVQCLECGPVTVFDRAHLAGERFGQRIRQRGPWPTLCEAPYHRHLNRFTQKLRAADLLRAEFRHKRPAAREGHDQSVIAERSERLAHGRATGAEDLRNLGLGNALSWDKLHRHDCVPQCFGNLQVGGPREIKRRNGQRLDVDLGRFTVHRTGSSHCLSIAGIPVCTAIDNA